ncbi:transcriptional protein SWT1 isoform X2 [Euwallacea fornicatus]|uniref:transcriptional protein SWT1 isoform X2 n=1 Tax=Euwallacea fornicatus TaxID=995702 RepID=UPI00338E0779
MSERFKSKKKRRCDDTPGSHSRRSRSVTSSKIPLLQGSKVVKSSSKNIAANRLQKLQKSIRDVPFKAGKGGSCGNSQLKDKYKYDAGSSRSETSWEWSENKVLAAKRGFANDKLNLNCMNTNDKGDSTIISIESTPPKNKVLQKNSNENESNDGSIIEVDEWPTPTKSLNFSENFIVVSELTDHEKSLGDLSDISSKTPVKEAQSRRSRNSSSDNEVCPKTSNNTTFKINPIFNAKVSKTSSPNKWNSLTNRIAKIKDGRSSFSLVENWIDNTQPAELRNNDSVSDSLMVNLDETLMNKTELLTEQVEDTSMEWDTSPNMLPPMLLPGNEFITSVVVDTNVFMHDLTVIRELLDYKVSSDLHKLVIYIPFMVLQELDYHKDRSGSHLKSLALAAQKFINKLLSESDSRIVGQSVGDGCLQMGIGKSPDDKILACCLQAKTKFDSVILLSNDINLRNKAITNTIKAYSSKDFVKKLKCGKFAKIKDKLHYLLSEIIMHCCQEAYGENCNKMEPLKGAPWSFDECLKRLLRYWSPVFCMLLLKQCSKTVKELLLISEKGGVMDTDIKQLNKFKELLFYLQDIEGFDQKVKKACVELDDIFQGNDNSLDFL